MRIRNRFSINRASRRIAVATLAAFVAAGGFAWAGDTTQQKAISDSASKVDLSAPISNLNFHGSATVGYESTFGKHARHSGMFSDVQLGTDFRLSKDVTMSIFVGAGRYPNCFGFFR